MRIVVRHEAASEEHGDRSCVWVVREDGETRETSYLEPGQELAIEVSPDGHDSLTYTFGPVVSEGTQEAEAAQAEEDAPINAAEEPSETLNAPEGSVEGGEAQDAAAEQQEQPQTD